MQKNVCVLHTDPITEFYYDVSLLAVWLHYFTFIAFIQQLFICVTAAGSLIQPLLNP